jgi:hypothetical protein
LRESNIETTCRKESIVVNLPLISIPDTTLSNNVSINPYAGIYYHYIHITSKDILGYNKYMENPWISRTTGTPGAHHLSEGPRGRK